LSKERELPFFAFVGFGVSKEGAVYETHRMWERDEDAIACIGFDIVLIADMVLYSDSYSLDHERRSQLYVSDVLFRALCLTLSKSTGRVASLDVMFIPQTSKSSTTMTEASSTAISSSPCHLGGITRLAFAPDGQYVHLTHFPLH
jgi:hypothetical protein